jgi:hypothetical protein
LNHVAGFPVVTGGLEARRDDDTVAIFMEDESVHATPPWITANRMLWPVVSLGPVGYPMKAANSTMDRFRV